jgi:hypothetical protein
MFEGKSLTWNEISMILFGSEFELETPSFYDLEPAPPKDWKPFCFHLFDGEETGKCAGVHKEAGFKKYCESCTFRK